MDELEFLQTVVTTETGRFCLSLRTQDSWQNLWYDWPQDAPSIIDKAREARGACDVYFSTYLSSCDDAHKDCALPTRTISADLDNADVTAMLIPPTLLVKTSEDRHQGFWILSNVTENHETLSRRLTYSIVDADPTGWPIGKKVRFPGTFNHKYETKPIVEVTAYNGHIFSPDELQFLPDVSKDKALLDNDFVELVPSPKGGVGPYELLEHIKSHIPARVYTGFKVAAPDRSAALWALMCSAFRAGLTREEVFFLASHSANNKFPLLRDLAKDVLRAEREAFVVHEDAREILDATRKANLQSTDRLRLILSTTIELMKRMGEFVATSEDAQWFITKDVGRPLYVSFHSEQLIAFLDNKLGLNYTEKETKYVLSGLNSFAKMLPVTGQLAQLAHYDRTTNTMMLHTGKKQVLRIAPNHVEMIVNGSHGLVFPWIPEMEPFSPIIPDSSYDSCWGTSIFGDSLSNIVNMDTVEALALLKVWLLSILFKGELTSKPLLAFFGPPGSGKSTVAKKIYAFLYGKQMKLGKITDDKSFDTAVSKYPLYIFDNVDTYEKWLPDRLAQMAGSISSSKKKLYTDNDMVTVTGTAHVGLTSFDPKFNRPDVIDRFLVFIFSRIHDFDSEEEMVGSVLTTRNKLWGHMVRDIQTILASPRPIPAPITLRSSDLVNLGRWADIPNFSAAVSTLQLEQIRITLREDQVLAEAILAYVKYCPTSDSFKSTSRLWLDMTLYGSKGGVDINLLLKRYKNAATLDKRLWILQESLSSVVDIEYREGISREWRICAKTISE